MIKRSKLALIITSLGSHIIFNLDRLFWANRWTDLPLFLGGLLKQKFPAEGEATIDLLLLLRRKFTEVLDYRGLGWCYCEGVSLRRLYIKDK